MVVILRKFLYLLFFGLFSTQLFSFFPEKDGYPYEKNGIDVYVGAGVGAVVSNTFGSYNGDHYKPLFSPTNFLASGSASANIGMRFLDNKDTFFNNFRIDAEWQYVYNWYDKLIDTSVVISSLDTSNFPDKGQEVLKNAYAINLYYDFRFFSEIFYPYLGFGLGYGQFKYLFVDTEAQPNSMGQQYEGNKRAPYYQAMIGLEYTNKIIKSSFYVQYKLIRSIDTIHIIPYNKGNDNLQNPDQEMPPGYTSPQPRDVTFFSHGIGFGFKYYLY